MSATNPSIRERILDAAFTAFMRLGYQGVSTAQIARLARVSKRDLYAQFGSKQAMLAVCVAERADRMREPLTLPAPSSTASLTQTLIEFGVVVVREVTRPEVLATYRLAIIEAENAPDVATTLDRHGRQANRQALTGLLKTAQDQGLLRGAEPSEMAEVFLAVLMSGGILIRMLMRLADAPVEAEARQRAETAARCLLRLYGVSD
jgi:AcrR family transcriptional regulator